MRRIVTAADVPCIAQLCYWGTDKVIREHDHQDVSVVAAAGEGFIILLGPEEIEVGVGAEADLILDVDDG